MQRQRRMNRRVGEAERARLGSRVVVRQAPVDELGWIL
jgi:hypothetical protein